MATAAARAIVPPAAMYMFVMSVGSSSRFGSALDGNVALSASYVKVSIKFNGYKIPSSFI
jgi:hypothetical protein